MQLISSTVPADPTLLPASFPGLSLGAPRTAASAIEPKASAAAAFGDLFPALGISPAAATEPNAESATTAAPALAIEPQAKPARRTESTPRWEFAPANTAPAELGDAFQAEATTEAEPGEANAFVSHRAPVSAKPCEPGHEGDHDADMAPEERAELVPGDVTASVTAGGWMASVVATPIPLAPPVELTSDAPPESTAPVMADERGAEMHAPQIELNVSARPTVSGGLKFRTDPLPAQPAFDSMPEDETDLERRIETRSDASAARAPAPFASEPRPRAIAPSAEVATPPSLPAVQPTTDTDAGVRNPASVDVTEPLDITMPPAATPAPSRPAGERFVAEAVERAAPDPLVAERTAPFAMRVNRPATPSASLPASVADIASAPVSVEAPGITGPRSAFPLDGAPLLPPTNGFSPRTSDAAAIFAASTPSELAATEVAQQGPVKSFVNASQESLTRRRPELGIGVAKANATMPERFLPTLSPHPVSEYGTGAAAIGQVLELAPRETAPAEVPTAPLEAVRSAHQAVEVALDAAEVVATGEQPTLDLNFSVGDAELSVHIKVQGDEVHATFRTDSAELRAALAQEWQSVATSSASDRGVRLAPATFAGADASALNSSAGNGSPRDHQSHAQRGESSRAAIAALGRSRHRGAESARPAPIGLRSLVAAATSRHLHTLA